MKEGCDAAESFDGLEHRKFSQQDIKLPFNKDAQFIDFSSQWL